MSKSLKSAIYVGKSPLKGWLLAACSALVLLMALAPIAVIFDVCKLYVKLDFFRAVQGTLWLINRSYLKVNQMGLGFNIADILSDRSRRKLLNSHFLSARDQVAVDKGQIILASLQIDPHSRFWRQKFRSHFNGYREKMDQFSRVKRIEKQKTPGKIAEKGAIVALEDFSQLYEKVPGEFFLVSGTFLGLVREGSFLRHDYDIDVGCFGADFHLDKFLDLIFRSDCFYLKEVTHYFEGPAERMGFEASQRPMVVKVLHASSVTIDLFIHYERSGSYIHGSSIHLWSNSKFDLIQYPFYDGLYFGAADYDLYLTENYGDWREEKKEFDCDLDTANLEFPSTPAAYLYLLENFGPKA